MTATRVWNVLGKTVLALGLTASLAGCPLIVIGGIAGGGALIATDRRTLGAQTEDREIQIKAAVRLSQQLPQGAHVDAAVYNRRVLLTGEVQNDAVRRQAEEIVRNINNVQGIVNELAVMPAASLQLRSSDTLITSKVQASLYAAGVPAQYMKVVTSRGTVYLMGLVTVGEGTRGADLASRVPGVMQVVKVFQYVTLPPGIGAQDTDVAAAQSVAAAPPPPPSNDGVTADAIPSQSVTSQPLQQQAPAPIEDSAPVHPGNAKAPQ